MASVMMRAPPAFAARKAAVAPTPPQPVKINGLQKAGMVITVGGSFILFGHLTTEADFEAEKKRVAKEVKKMEKMKKEFTDIDEGVDTDADLMAALNKRKSELANSTATDSDGNPLEGGEEGGSDAPPSSPPPPPPPPPPPTGAGEGGSSALLERPDPDAQAPSADAPERASQEQQEMLKRMFGGGDFGGGDDA